MEDTTTSPKTSHAAINRLGLPPLKRSGASHRHDFRIVLANGVEYEVGNCRNVGHARLVARIAEEQKCQRNGAIVRTEKLPFDPRRFEVRPGNIAV